MTKESINIPISPGELIDRITILEIKKESIKDPEKLKNIEYEYGILFKIKNEEMGDSEELEKLHTKLRDANQSIWNSEDAVRENWDDDQKFIEAAKNSHYQNEERSRVKRAINDLLGSLIMEEKEYPNYEH